MLSSVGLLREGNFSVSSGCSEQTGGFVVISEGDKSQFLLTLAGKQVGIQKQCSCLLACCD